MQVFWCLAAASIPVRALELALKASRVERF